MAYLREALTLVVGISAKEDYHNPPEKSDNFAKAEKAVPLQAKSSRLWDDTVDLMSPLRQKWQSPQVKESLNSLATEYRV